MELNQIDQNLYYPQDWEIINLGDVIDYVKGFAFKTKDYKKDGIRIIRVSDTTYDSIKENNGIYLDPKEISLYKNWELKEYDLILSTVGSKPPMYDSMVGKVILIDERFSGSLLNQNAVIIRAKKDFKEKQIFLFNFFKTKKYIRYIETIFRGNANQANITLSDLFKLELTIPTNQTELRKIAQVLSDTDELISSLEKLIEKKKLIKQGTLNTLFTFKNNWTVHILKDLVYSDRNIRYGIVQPGTYDYTGRYMVRGQDYSSGWANEQELFRVSSAIEERYKNARLQTNDLIMTIVGTVGLVVIVPDWLNGANITQTTARISIDPEKANVLFVKYYFESEIGKTQIRNFIKGAVQPGLNIRDVEIFEVPSPKIDEQNIITQILIDIDSEIKSLEQKLYKYKSIKQGMMQNLLTGKIRLVKPNNEAA